MRDKLQEASLFKAIEELGQLDIVKDLFGVRHYYLYVLFECIESIISMLFKHTLIKNILSLSINKFLLSSIRRRPPRVPISNQAEVILNYDYDNFDYFETIKKLHNTIGTNIQVAKIKQSKKLYQAADEQSTRMLRFEIQKLIIKISQGQFCYEQLQKLLNLIIAMQFRFRRWDDMILNINNCIQAFKYEKQQAELTSKLLLRNYHKLCAIFIMNDHEQLYELLNFEPKLTERKRKIQKNQKTHPFGVGFEQYHKIQFDFADDEIPGSQANQILLMQAKGLLVLGKKQIALRKLATLTGEHLNKQIREQAYLAIVTSLNFKANGSQPLSQKQIENIKQANNLSIYDARQLAASHITVEQCQDIISGLLQHFHKKSIAFANSQILSKYWNILALTCQNYYIDEKQSEYLRFSSVLRNKKHDHLNFMLNYFDLARFLDKNDPQNAEAMFQQMQATDEEFKDGLRPFYRSDMLIFDQLRVNILKMGCGIYELKGDKQNSEEYLDLSELLQCKLGVYTIREPNEEIMESRSLTADWRKTVSGRVPYYYLNLQLQKIFVVEENVFGQDQL